MSDTVVVANPGADIYGSDLQLLQSVAGLREAGWNVVVATAAAGPLAARIQELGAVLLHRRFPVLRRSSAGPRGIVTLLGATVPAVRAIRSLITEHAPAVVYVNTITIPWWLLAAHTLDVPTLCHVHEAERSDSWPLRLALTTPLRYASTCVVNSHATREVIEATQPGLADRIRLIHNGVPGPPDYIPETTLSGRVRLIVVGRLSARKGAHLAVEAVSTLLSRGYDVELELCGSALSVHSEYADLLARRSAEPALAGRVRLRGYASPVWPALAESDILIAPSYGESFGNAVVEAQLARRTVVATAVQGHLETVSHERTGLLVPLDDSAAIATAVARLIDKPTFARELASRAQRTANERFSTQRYDADIVAAVDSTAAMHRTKTTTRGVRST